MSEWNWVELQECQSTNDEARTWLSQNPGSLGVIWSKKQTAGRGRLGRAWFSREGESLTASLVFPSPVSAERAPQVTLLGAVALAKACDAAGVKSDIEVKWPNDLLVAGHKVAGILTEWCAAEGHGAIVMGVGLNVSIRREDFPTEIQGRASSLFGDGQTESTIKSILDVFVSEMGTLLSVTQRQGRVDMDLVVERMNLGRGVLFVDGVSQVRGSVIGLSEDGALRLRTEDGKEKVILAGDVLPLEWEG